MTLLFIGIIVHLLLTSYVFRFQRTTLGICRLYFSGAIHTYQTLLTPVWMGTLGWLSTGIFIAVLVGIVMQYGWLWALGYFIFNQLWTGIFDFINPFPTYDYCFGQIKKNLDAQKNKAKDEIEKTTIEILYKKVEMAQKERGKNVESANS